MTSYTFSRTLQQIREPAETLSAAMLWTCWLPNDRTRHTDSADEARQNCLLLRQQATFASASEPAELLAACILAVKGAVNKCANDED